MVVGVVDQDVMLQIGGRAQAVRSLEQGRRAEGEHRVVHEAHDLEVRPGVDAVADRGVEVLAREVSLSGAGADRIARPSSSIRPSSSLRSIVVL